MIVNMKLGPEEAEAKRAAQIAKGRTRFAELSGAGAGAVTTGAAPIPHQKVFTSVRRDETQQSSSRSVFFLNTRVCGIRSRRPFFLSFSRLKCIHKTISGSTL